MDIRKVMWYFSQFLTKEQRKELFRLAYKQQRKNKRGKRKKRRVPRLPW